jgi:protein-disulfide isomerase
MKQIIITVLVVVGIIGGAVLLSGGEDNVAGAESNNFYGQEEGIITVTEFADFQCPACAGFYPIISQVKEQFADQVRFEYKHFPLVQIHPNATTAHRAAQAAANQGKFWEMHDLLFERQQSWSDSTNSAGVFEQYARELGLDMDKYQAEVNTSEILSVINADIEAGKSRSVTGTPTFFIDGEVIEDTSTISTVDGFSRLIQEKIDAKTGQSSEGTEAPAPEQPEATVPEETVTE